ncbi:MAG: hypothetical protein ACKVHR_10400 [Pirellulales bacterium]
MTSDPKKKDEISVHNQTMIGAGVAIGMGVGIAIGSALGNVGAGIAIGIAIGIGFGVSLQRKNESDKISPDDIST